MMLNNYLFSLYIQVKKHENFIEDPPPPFKKKNPYIKRKKPNVIKKWLILTNVILQDS